MKRRALIILCVVIGFEFIATAVNHFYYSHIRVKTLSIFSKTTVSDPNDMEFFLNPERYSKFQKRNLIIFPVGLVSYIRIHRLESQLNRIYEDYINATSEARSDVETYKSMLWLFKAEAKFAGFHNLHNESKENPSAQTTATPSSGL